MEREDGRLVRGLKHVGALVLSPPIGLFTAMRGLRYRRDRIARHRAYPEVIPTSMVVPVLYRDEQQGFIREIGGCICDTYEHMRPD